MDKAITIDPKEIEMEKDANGNDVLLGVGTYGRVGSLLVVYLYSHPVLLATQSSTSGTLQGHETVRFLLGAACLSCSHSKPSAATLPSCTKDPFLAQQQVALAETRCC